MKIEWKEFLNKTINVTMNENYGVVYNNKIDDQNAFYEIVFKTGKLEKVFDDGLLLSAQREDQQYEIFIPYESIKCVEIFN